MTTDQLRDWLTTDPEEATRIINIGLGQIVIRPYLLEPIDFTVWGISDATGSVAS